MIGYIAGDSPLHRAHPYTPVALAASLFLAAFAAGTPAGVGVVLVASAGLAALGGTLRRSIRPALALSLPIWALLLVLHGLLGPQPHEPLGPIPFSASGIRRAVVLGGRLTAIVIGSLTLLGCVSPARLVEAMTARGVPFGRMYLLVSTLTLLPRMRERAARILEAQQCRGLRVGGSPVARVRALGPLVVPLVLSALAEVDEQVLALDARGVAGGARRTPLWPPADPAGERLLRWGLLAGVVLLYVLKLRGLI